MLIFIHFFSIVLVTPFNKILKSPRKISQISFISSFEFIKLFFQSHVFYWISALFSEAAAVISNGAKIFLAKGTATFINGPVILLNNEPKNLSD